jgi:hypothetical protein
VEDRRRLASKHGLDINLQTPDTLARRVDHGEEAKRPRARVA